jgi:hypothetical protein
MKIIKAKKDKSQRYKACFASKDGSFDLTETLKLTVLLFRETTETNLVSDSVKTNSGSFDMNQVLQDILPYGIGRGGGLRFCVYSCFASKVISFGSTKTLKLVVSVFRETTETNLFFRIMLKNSFGSFYMKRVL